MIKHMVRGGHLAVTLTSYESRARGSADIIVRSGCAERRDAPVGVSAVPTLPTARTDGIGLPQRCNGLVGAMRGLRRVLVAPHSWPHDTGTATADGYGQG